MKQVLNKPVRQRTKVIRHFEKKNYFKEVNEEKKVKRKIKISKEQSLIQKKRNKNYEDVSVRLSELKISIFHYKIDIFL